MPSKLLKEIEEIRGALKQIEKNMNENFVDIKQVLTRALALNYLFIISRHLVNEMNAVIDRLECPRERAKEMRCKQIFKDKVKEYTDRVSDFQIDKALNMVKKLLKIGEHRINDPNYPEDCKNCWRRLRPVLLLHNEIIKSIWRLEHPYPTKIETFNAKNLDVTKLFSEIIKPLAHRVRLEIMKDLIQGNRRFVEIAKTTKLSSGHLVYHLNLLIKHGLVQRDEKKNYGLSPKGYWILAALSTY
jgi:DNA-binding HxlR family transcriptional regulator